MHRQTIPNCMLSQSIAQVTISINSLLVCCMLAGPLSVNLCRPGSRPRRPHGRAAHGAHRRAGTVFHHCCYGGCWRPCWGVCRQPAGTEAAEHQAQGAVSSCAGVLVGGGLRERVSSNKLREWSRRHLDHGCVAAVGSRSLRASTFCRVACGRRPVADVCALLPMRKWLDGVPVTERFC